ncbi:MAG: signal recognition particle-docking protein FtsY [Blastopirellula sp.]|nr:MAG: signal recognition particle-docking protein FtsY [Blastopirellula sp.]
MGLFDAFKKTKPKQDPPVETPAEEPAETPAEQPEEQPKQGFFTRLKKGLVKTSQVLNTDIRDLFKDEGRLIDDDFLTDIYAILIRTDMGTGPAGAIRDTIKKEFRGRVVHLQEVLSRIKQELIDLMKEEEAPIRFAESGPTVIMVVGVNGAGKTTSIAKLAHLLKSEGKTVLLGAGDTFRAAAVQQLTIWAERVGVGIVQAEQGSDPASVAFRTVDQAIADGVDVVILDTAGRLQTQTNLMGQLEKMRRVAGKKIEEAPHEVLLVLDATAGQNGISQAKGFSDAAKCTGIILTKLDGTAKGGVVVPIRQEFGLPVKYIGVGEKAEDFSIFNAEEFGEALFSDTIDD